MKTDNELKILHKIKLACEEMLQHAFNYQEYEKKHTFSLDVKEKQKLFQLWYSSLSNVLISILDSKDVFLYNIELWNEVDIFSNTKIEIPKTINFSRK